MCLLSVSKILQSGVIYSPSFSAAPHDPVVWGPCYFICAGQVNCPGIKVLPLAKRLERRTCGGAKRRPLGQLDDLQPQLLGHKVVHLSQSVVQLEDVGAAAHGAVGLAAEPHKMRSFHGDPVYLICAGQVNCPGIKVLVRRCRIKTLGRASSAP